MRKHANLSIFIPHLGCSHRCIFCDQKKISGETKEPTPEDVDSLCWRYLNPSNHFDTEIAFFGGSFTSIDRQYMISLLEVASKYVREGKATGIRISTRPDAISHEILSVLNEYSVTAIELGAQSINNRVLEENKRGHTENDIYNSSQLIKEYNFSLGLQMMIGMYGETDYIKGAIETTNRFIDIRPDTVRIYPTLVLKDTELESKYLKREYTPLSIEEAAIIAADLVMMFEKERISVIRCGLHSDESLIQNITAGPFHPAFGELTRSYIYRNILLTQIGSYAEGEYTVHVSETEVGAMVGLNRMNISYFKDMGYTLKVKGSRWLKGYEVAIDSKTR